MCTCMVACFNPTVGVQIILILCLYLITYQHWLRYFISNYSSLGIFHTRDNLSSDIFNSRAIMSLDAFIVRCYKLS